jgi:hypothetical protein
MDRSRERQHSMVRQTMVKKLGDGQRTVLMLGTEGPVTRDTLASPGLKVALFSLKRLDLIDKKTSVTTAAGVQALRDGFYPVSADPLNGPFEANVRALMAHWGIKRLEAIRRAVALQAKAIADETEGE